MNGERARFIKNAIKITSAVAFAFSAAAAKFTQTARAEAGNVYTCAQLMAPPQNEKPAGPGLNPDGSPRYYNNDPLKRAENLIYCVTDPKDGSGSLTHGLPQNK